MDIYILDQTFRTVALIDTFGSFLWIDRYNGFGDFEIYTFVDADVIRDAQQDYYVWSSQSEHLMMIDERIINSDVESGNTLTIRGRSLEWLLNRRIIWAQTNLTGNFQNGIQKLLNENVINPSIAARRIDNFIFQPSTDPRITSMTIDKQFTGTNLYEAIRDLCTERELGFKIVLNNNNQFVFSLYMGSDRSYSQIVNPHVVFSPGFDNIINSNYFETNRVIKNVALIAGEGEGAARRTTTVGGVSGLARRELFVDARDISSDTQDGILTNSQYIALLASRGDERLAEYQFVQTFEGDVEATQMFVYKTDFFIGDVVQIVNEFGLEASVRIIEIVFSNNNSGNNVVPTFKVIP